MAHTFWYCGILIGESELETAPDRPRRLAGIFQPTAYGLEVFPRLTGILTAGHALKTYLDANGLSPDEMSKREIEDILETNPAGQKVIDIGRALCEVEMRDPGGSRLEFASIAFSDLLELHTLARELAVDPADDMAELPPDAPRYMVSATLRGDTEESDEEATVGVPNPPWPRDN